MIHRATKGLLEGDVGQAPLPSLQTISGKGSSLAGQVCAVTIITAAWLRGMENQLDLVLSAFRCVILGQLLALSEPGGKRSITMVPPLLQSFVAMTVEEEVPLLWYPCYVPAWYPITRNFSTDCRYP